MLEPARDSQKRAWHSCFQVLQHQLCDLGGDPYLIFEYELPRERGRRPDVIMLACGTIVVLEFKDRDSAHEDSEKSINVVPSKKISNTRALCVRCK